MLRGLKPHKRSCRVIKGLNKDVVSTSDTETDEIINNNLDDFIAENLPELKPVIKLPKTETGWKEADTYLRSVLHAGDINISNLNISVKNMNNIIYEYFVKNFGTIEKKELEDELNKKYKDYGKLQLNGNLKRNKIKTLLQFVLYQSCYAIELIIRTIKFLYQIMMLNYKNNFGDTLKLSLIMTRI